VTTLNVQLRQPMTLMIEGLDILLLLMDIFGVL
jgi:hypothetical protein